MAFPERLKGLRFIDHDAVHHAREQRDRNATHVSDVLWNSGIPSRITRPSVKQLKNDGISFFVTLDVNDETKKIPIMVAGSKGAAQEYEDEHKLIIKRKGIIIIVASTKMVPKTILNNFKKKLAQDLNIQLPKRAGVAELVNAPV